MRLIGNYDYWIDPLWEHLVLTRTGQSRPRDWSAMNHVELAEYKKYQEAGYDLNAVNWYVYESQDLGIDIDPPWCKGKIHWWITKLNPGQYMPMHTDPHTHDGSCKRYWVPLQNYVPGHIFIYKDEMVSHYGLGDVYVYDHSTDPHGAANISHTPRIILQITEYAE
jgi:hypothetical protein